MDKKYLIRLIAISAVLGACVFVTIYGFYVLNPFYTDYIAAAAPDLSQHYLGFDYFKDAPWSFPLGKFNTLSYPFMTSVYNTDSIPLFAIFFKLLNPILPNHYQYFGIWGILCYMLQSVFGMLIVRKFCKKGIIGDITAVAAGLLFVLLPNFIIQIFWHSSLCTHWLILMALLPLIYYREFNCKTKLIIFCLTGFISSSVHPYMTVMCAIVTMLYVLYELYNAIKEKQNYKAVLSAFVPIIAFCFVSLITLWIFGGFSMNSVWNAHNLKNSSMNLNAFYNANYYESSFLKAHLYHHNTQLEGYAYFGLGLLCFLVITFILFILDCFKKTIPDIIKENKIKLFVIFAGIIVSIIIALSPVVTFDNNVLFEIPIPDWLYNFWSIFRATGRFVFIASCLIPTAALIYFLSRSRKTVALIIILLIASIQIADMSKLSKRKRSKYNHHYIYKDAINREVWNNIKKNNPGIKVLYISDMVSSANLFELAHFAKENNLVLNNFYFARTIPDAQNLYALKLKKQSDDVFFIINDEKIEHNKNLTKYITIKDLYTYTKKYDPLVRDLWYLHYNRQ